MKKINGGVCASKGFVANGIHCGIRKNKDKLDLALIACDKPCAVASVYTQNKVKGAPIIVTQAHTANGIAQAIICNSGNANTCNYDGEKKAIAMCELVSTHLGINPCDVVVASTGVIGQVLPLEPIQSGITSLVDGLSNKGSTSASYAIMTTDTINKEFAYQFEIGNKICHIGAIAKGSGMIHPNMATLLCFITTDVAISRYMLDKALKLAVLDTLNMVSVDGDTSTNDMLTIMASHQADNDIISCEDKEFDKFYNALLTILTDISRAIARDGEGATKLLECRVIKAKDKNTARAIAKSVICSSLLKTAIFASDANWGRILCAIGYADADFNIDKIDVAIQSEEGSVDVCKGGTGVDFCEQRAKDIMLANEIIIAVNCNDKNGTARAWGCDLTYDYVKINAEYRT